MLHFVSKLECPGLIFMCTLIKLKPGFSEKLFWSLEVPFKTDFTVVSIQIWTRK
jgi:hypothetical protein